MVFGLDLNANILAITYRYGYIGDDFGTDVFADVDDKEGIMTSMPKGFSCPPSFPT